MIQLVCPFCGCFSDELSAPRTFMCPKCSKNVEYIEPVVNVDRTMENIVEYATLKDIVDSREKAREKSTKQKTKTYDVDETLDDIVEGE